MFIESLLTYFSHIGKINARQVRKKY